MDAETLRHLQQSIVLSSGMPFHPAQVQHPPQVPSATSSGPSPLGNARIEWSRMLADRWWQTQPPAAHPTASSILTPERLPPLLRLPSELILQIFSHVLPRTSHLRKASVRRTYGSDVVWHRTSVNLLLTCKALHDAAANFMYGENLFVLRTRFDKTEFQFRRLKSGLVPTTTPAFPACFAERYVRKIRKVVLFIEVVDEYTGIIKYGYGSKGQAAGVRTQVERLAKVLSTCEDLVDVRVVLETSGQAQEGLDELLDPLKDLTVASGRIRLDRGSQYPSGEQCWLPVRERPAS